jgi:hypothetical protein
MPVKRSRTYEAQEPEKDDEMAPEVPTSFATKDVGWSGREQEGPNELHLNEKEK